MSDDGLILGRGHRSFRGKPIHLAKARGAAGGGKGRDRNAGADGKKAFRLPPSFVKVTGRKRGDLQQLTRHIEYVTRNGKLEFHTSDGDTLAGPSTKHELLARWRPNLGKDPPVGSTEREAEKYVRAIALIVSTPKGITKEQLEPMVQQFAMTAIGPAARFGFAIHEDKDNTHAHIVIPAVGHDGRKIQLDKEELQRLRVEWARAAADHGLFLDASNRFERGLDQAALKAMDRATFYSGKSPDERQAARGNNSSAIPGPEAKGSKRLEKEVREAVRDHLNGKLEARQVDSARRWGQLVERYRDKSVELSRSGGDAAEIGFYQAMTARQPPKLRGTLYIEAIRDAAKSRGESAWIVQVAAHQAKVILEGKGAVNQLLTVLDQARGDTARDQ